MLRYARCPTVVAGRPRRDRGTGLGQSPLLACLHPRRVLGLRSSSGRSRPDCLCQLFVSASSRNSVGMIVAPARQPRSQDTRHDRVVTAVQTSVTHAVSKPCTTLAATVVRHGRRHVTRPAARAWIAPIQDCAGPLLGRLMTALAGAPRCALFFENTATVNAPTVPSGDQASLPGARPPQGASPRDAGPSGP